MNTYCFKIYHLYEDLDDIVYIGADSKREAIAIMEEEIRNGKIADYKFLGQE